MLRNMPCRHWTTATKTGPVIDIDQIECTVWGHQTIHTIAIQTQNLARLLAHNMLLHNGMANVALAQAYQLRWHICRVACKHHIICLHGVHITTFDPPSCGVLRQPRTDSLDRFCGVERDDYALWEGQGG